MFSLGLIFIGESRIPFFQTASSYLNLVVLPIQYIVNTPIKMTQWLASSITTQDRLLAENARLRAHEFLLQARLQRLLTLEKENGELRELLQSSSHVGGKVIVAQLLAVDLNPGLQQMIVDKGSKDHVYVGQPVLDAYGVVGQIVNVGLLTSKVLLLTDSRSTTPVQNYRNGVRAFAMGQGESGTLVLMNVPETTDIKQGDLMVTSGLDLRYPVGYPVGMVIDIQHIQGEHFVKVTLSSLAHIDRTQQVLLAWPNDASLAKAVQKQLETALPSS